MGSGIGSAYPDRVLSVGGCCLLFFSSIGPGHVLVDGNHERDSLVLKKRD